MSIKSLSLFLFLFPLSACQPVSLDTGGSELYNDNLPAASHYRTLQLDHPKLNKEDVADSLGYCHMFSQPRVFFRFFNQPKSDIFRFSMEVEKGIESEVGKTLSEKQAINIQKQLQVADTLYKEVLGLTPPLAGLRYQQAKFINITYAAAPRVYGVAYDEVVTNKQLGFGNCFISLKLSNQINAVTNLTPAHELFHLYQNSNMMFKQAWLTEGTAEWIAALFKAEDKEKSSISLPRNREELLQVMDKKYDASQMWYRLFRLVDSDPAFNIPKRIEKEVYLTGEPIVVDNKAYGTEFMAVLFDELAKESVHVSEQQGWLKYGWREKDQKDKALNPYIWQAIKRAVNKTVPKEQQTDELKQFLAIELMPSV